MNKEDKLREDIEDMKNAPCVIPTKNYNYKHILQAELKGRQEAKQEIFKEIDEKIDTAIRKVILRLRDDPMDVDRKVNRNDFLGIVSEEIHKQIKEEFKL